MIYYITAKAPNGDEWIMSSHDNADAATTALESYRKGAESLMSGHEGVEFRIDTVMSNEEVREANTRIPHALVMWADYKRAEEKRQQRLREEVKARLNANFGKAKMDHEEGYPDSDSIRTEDFTVEELFTERAEGDYIASPCKECGALVIDTGFHDYTAKHVAWHNKLLP